MVRILSPSSMAAIGPGHSSGISPWEGEPVLPQPSQCREWWVGFLLIAMITVSLEPKWRHFAQVNIADIFRLSSTLRKQNENVSKSREKSYGANTQTAPKQQKQQYFFLLCLGASLCNSGLLAGVNMRPEVFWVYSTLVPVRWTKYPANPKGAV